MLFPFLTFAVKDNALFSKAWMKSNPQQPHND
jgi:hypothetical protein